MTEVQETQKRIIDVSKKLFAERVSCTCGELLAGLRESSIFFKGDLAQEVISIKIIIFFIER